MALVIQGLDITVVKPSGNVNGSSGHGGPSPGGGYHYNPGKGPAITVGPDGEVHINITGGMEKGSSRKTSR